MGWSAEPTMRELLTLLLGFALAQIPGRAVHPQMDAAAAAADARIDQDAAGAAAGDHAVQDRRPSGAPIGRTGILIYLSMGEHRAEIVGDEAITAVTTPETWGEAMAALLTDVKAGRPGDGIVAAVELIGAVLAEHFPQDAASDTNEIPDKLIEL